MGRQVNNCNEDVANNSASGNYENYHRFSILDQISKAIEIIQLQIDEDNIINDEQDKQEGVEWEDIRYIMRMLDPLLAIQAPAHTEDYHKYVDQCQYLCPIFYHQVGTRLNDCGV